MSDDTMKNMLEMLNDKLMGVKRAQETVARDLGELLNLLSECHQYASEIKTEESK